MTKGRIYLTFVMSAFILAMRPTLYSQQILNGSFEMNDVDCGINMTNENFNAHVLNITAFGGQSEIDLLSDSCDYDQSIDGGYFVAMYNFTFSDAISFGLTSPIQANKLYNLRFASRLGEGISNNNSQVRIGLSNAADNFGTPIFIAPILDKTWQYYQTQFSPTSTVDFITVSVLSNDETWVFIDDFSLECPTINLGNDTTYCVVENLVLEVDGYFETYLWSDHSIGSSIEVNEPGEYWVTTTDGNCIISDTINIEEIAFNCDCKIYFPNTFSPNNDGFNDEFFPVSPCDFLEYELTIFDRWGQLVFRSSEENEKWDGSMKGRLLDSGVFAYLFQYRFFYQNENNIASGNISILR